LYFWFSSFSFPITRERNFFPLQLRKFIQPFQCLNMNGPIAQTGRSRERERMCICESKALYLCVYGCVFVSLCTNVCLHVCVSVSLSINVCVCQCVFCVCFVCVCVCEHVCFSLSEIFCLFADVLC
jgi:hypothetical protein